MDKESKNGHSGAKKTNRFQSGFQDELLLIEISGFFSIRIQTEQTVSRKKSGLRASPITALNIQKETEKSIYYEVWRFQDSMQLPEAVNSLD